MSDFSKEILRELGLAGPFGLSLKELFYNLNILKRDDRFQQFVFNNLKLLDLGIIFTGTGSSLGLEELSMQDFKSNSHYRFIVSQDQREWAVYGSFYKSLAFSDATFLIFSLIAKCKALGISQAELGKAAKMDAKNVFHHLKVLGKAKVIVKYPIIHNRVKTHLCIHYDYADQNQGYNKHVQLRTTSTDLVIQDDFSFVDSGINHSDLVKVKISSMLENAKNQILATEDLFDVIQEESDDSFLRRVFNRTLQQMQNSENIEIVYVRLEEEKILRAAKLIKPFRLNKSKDFTGFEKNSASSIKYALKRSNDLLLDQSVISQGRFLADFTMEWQVFRLIYLSGSQGLTSNMLFKSLRMEGVKMMDKILERLLKGDGSKGLSITKVFENIGREKRYRYFACKKAVNHFKDAALGSESSNEKKSLKSAIHLSSLQRRNNLLELLEIHKVLDCGNALMDVYENLMEERGTQTGYRIDRKTLLRTAKSLQDDQLLSMHVIRIPHMAGAVLSKTILLHKSLTIKSPLVQDFIESTQIKLSQSNTCQKRILEDVELERLDSRKKKKRAIQKSPTESSLIEDAPVYRGDHDPNLIEFPFPAQESEEETENQNSTNWIACLLKHGYVQSIIPRSRIMHAWLFQKLLKQRDQESFTDENDGWFSLSMLLNDLDFGMYMKLVGIINEPPALTEFLEKGDYSNYTTGNLPPNVREALFSRGYVRYRREIRNIMNELERLKVISPGENQQSGDPNLWTKFKLNSEIAIASAETSFNITDLETLGHFWVKVNHIESKIEMAARQRKSRKKKTTTESIAPKTTSASSEVIPLEKDKDHMNSQPSPSVAEIMKLERREVALVPSVKSRLSSKKEPAKKGENILTMKAINQNDHIKPRQRVQWTSEELLNLFIYYSILSHESRPKKILIWKTITGKFPHYGESRCKKQIEGAKKDHFLKSQLDWLKKKWEHTIKENFNSGPVNFDLDQFAELLLSKVDFQAWSAKENFEEEPDSDNSPYKSSVCSLDERNIEKFINEKQTIKAKLNYLLKFPFTCHLYNPEIDDYSREEISDYELKKKIAKATIKSILLTSESNYDPIVASGMLESINPSILDEAFSELNSANILSKVKGGKTRRGPGRGYQLSDKFLTSLSAGFPYGFISNAKSFLDKLTSASNEPIEYSLSISRGEMSCILNEIPQEKIKFNPLVSLLVDESFESQEYCFPISVQYINSGNPKRQLTISNEESESHTLESNESKKRRTKDADSGSTASKLTTFQEQLLTIIKNSGVFGATISDIKKSINSSKLASTQSITADLAALEISNISKVGFSITRYVEKIHLKSWQIQKGQESYPAELWYDISGEIIPIFLETALENAVSVIHDFPGIYFSKLLQMLPVTFVELQKLLEILENNGIIQRNILFKPEIAKLYNFIEKQEISNEISSYRLAVNWYKNMECRITTL